MSRLSPSDIAGARSCVRPEFSKLPAEELERLVEQSVSGLAGDASESFFKTLGSLGKAVAPVMERAAPNILQGATTGASVGGPWGALIGAGAGLASSALNNKPHKAAAPVPSGPAGTPTAPVLPTGPGAAATLLSLLQNPAVQQSLLSQALGFAGGQQTRTSTGASLPHGAINNVLSQLLANSSEGLDDEGLDESVSDDSYLLGEDGEYLVDPASPEQQAALVLSHLRFSGQTRPTESAEDAGDNTEWMDAGEWDETTEWAEEDGVPESTEWAEADESAESVEWIEAGEDVEATEDVESVEFY